MLDKVCRILRPSTVKSSMGGYRIVETLISVQPCRERPLDAGVLDSPQRKQRQIYRFYLSAGIDIRRHDIVDFRGKRYRILRLDKLSLHVGLMSGVQADAEYIGSCEHDYSSSSSSSSSSSTSSLSSMSSVSSSSRSSSSSSSRSSQSSSSKSSSSSQSSVSSSSQSSTSSTSSHSSISDGSDLSSSSSSSYGEPAPIGVFIIGHNAIGPIS